MFEYVLGVTFGFIGFFAIIYYIAEKSVKSAKEVTPDFIRDGRYLVFIKYTGRGLMDQDSTELYMSDATTMAELRTELEDFPTAKAYIVELKRMVEMQGGHLFMHPVK